jgi:hypothetical protein
VLAVTTVQFHHDRYFFPLVPPVLAWCGPGLVRLCRWTYESAANWGLDAPFCKGLAAWLVMSWVILVVVASAVGVRLSDDLSQSWTKSLEDVEIGKWLKKQAGDRVRIMDTYPTAAYYAGAVLVNYPWSDGEPAVRYAIKKDVSYLILRNSDCEKRPYLEEWIWSGPGEFAKLKKTLRSASGDVIRIYGCQPKQTQVAG